MKRSSSSIVAAARPSKLNKSDCSWPWPYDSLIGGANTGWNTWTILHYPSSICQLPVANMLHWESQRGSMYNNRALKA